VTASLEALARALVARPDVTSRAPVEGAASPDDPADLRALDAVTSGLELADGTRILPPGERARATAWLVEDRALEWDDDLVVVGERADLVIVRDRDRDGLRAGGGLLEAPHDALETFRRASMGLVGWLAERAGAGVDPTPSPERLARDAMAVGDAGALARALEDPFYPGAARDFAHAALRLGALRAASGDDAAALEAFARSASARVAAVSRGASVSEAQSAWRACAKAAEDAGRSALAAECAARAAR
jgi:hypothetical protein